MIKRILWASSNIERNQTSLPIHDAVVTGSEDQTVLPSLLLMSGTYHRRESFLDGFDISSFALVNTANPEYYIQRNAILVLTEVDAEIPKFTTHVYGS
jgi:hypothetical protein